MGISKLGEEMVSKSINRRQEEINRHLNDVSKWLENNYDYVMKMRDSHEKSISSIGDDHVKFDMKIERSYRELASKILDVENRLSRIEKGAGAGRFQQANSGKKRR
jgi:flagellar hook assembly protein FlgD